MQCLSVVLEGKTFPPPADAPRAAIHVEMLHARDHFARRQVLSCHCSKGTFLA